MQQISWADIMSCQRVSVNPWRIILGWCWADVGPVGQTSGHWRPCFLGYLGHFMTDHYDGIAYCFLWVCALCTHILYSVSFFKNTKRHTAHTIVSWPNPKQWVIVHTPDLMMIIRQSIYIPSIITRKWVNWKHSPTYCIMDNWENMPYLTHTLDKIYLTGIL